MSAVILSRLGWSAPDVALILVSHDEAFLEAVGTHRQVRPG